MPLSSDGKTETAPQRAAADRRVSRHLLAVGTAVAVAWVGAGILLTWTLEPTVRRATRQLFHEETVSRINQLDRRLRHPVVTPGTVADAETIGAPSPPPEFVVAAQQVFGGEDLFFEVTFFDPKEKRPTYGVVKPPDLGSDIRAEKELNRDPFFVEGQLTNGQGLRVRLSHGEVDRRSQRIVAVARRLAGWTWSAGAIVIFAALVLLWRTAKLVENSLGRREQEARLAEVGILAAGLAHEIRNPLNSLRLNVQLFEEDEREGHDPGGGSGRLRQLGTIRHEVERLERLLTDFLHYARPRRPQRRETDLADLVDEILIAMRGEFEKGGVVVEVDRPKESPRAFLDPEQVTQVVRNLLGNALDALSARPTVGGARIRIEIASEGYGWVRIAVADSGPGVSPSELPRLGTLFYSTKRGGTGLGLPIARRICEEHGGELRFESVEGRGLRAVARFPRSAP